MFRTPQGMSSPDLTSPSGESPVVFRKRNRPELEMMDMFNALQADLKDSFLSLHADMDTKLNNINDSIGNMKSDLVNYSSQIKKELDEVRAENKALNRKIDDLSREVDSLRTSTQFIADQQDSVRSNVESLTCRVRNATQLEPVIIGLQTKIDSLEQQARSCNLEITNIPEKRGENLHTLLESIGDNIGCTISKKDVTAVHRVPHAHESTKPKNIIAKLVSRTLRDNVLSAFRLNKGLKTDQLGLSGTAQTVYLNEHLTLRNKGLFRETREAAREYGFRYVWTKHATILVRKSDTSHVLAIRSSKDIDKMAAPTSNVLPPSATRQVPHKPAPTSAPRTPQPGRGALPPTTARPKGPMLRQAAPRAVAPAGPHSAPAAACHYRTPATTGLIGALDAASSGGTPAAASTYGASAATGPCDMPAATSPSSLHSLSAYPPASSGDSGACDSVQWTDAS